MDADRRKLLIVIIGGIVAAALVVVAVVTLSGGDGDGGKEAQPVVQPLRLTSPPDTSGIVGVDGSPAQLSQAELDAILTTVQGYLEEATVTPLSQERPDEGETTTTLPGTPSLAGYFTPVAAGRLHSDDQIVLHDSHLPFAKGGVSTVRATVALAGIVQDGSAQFVNAAIDVLMLAKGDEEITIRRTGDLILRPVEGEWKIAGYKLAVERAFGDHTTTSSEAAFGA